MIENLEALRSLKKNGTMIKAATELRISQSAVSKRIANLESQLNRKLIVKTGRKVSLTIEGINLLNKAIPLLAEIRCLHNTEKPGIISSLSIGLSESILSSWGAKSIASFSDHFPQTELIPHAHRSPVVIDRVQSGEYILGVCVGGCIKAPDLDYKEIGYENFAIITSHKSNKKEILTIEESSETWISISNQAKKLNIVPTKRLESFFSIAQIAKFGNINALVPLGVAKSLGISKKHLKTTSIKRPIILIGRRTTLERKDLRPIINHLISSFSKELLVLKKLTISQ